MFRNSSSETNIGEFFELLSGNRTLGGTATTISEESYRKNPDGFSGIIHWGTSGRTLEETLRLLNNYQRYCWKITRGNFLINSRRYLWKKFFLEEFSEELWKKLEINQDEYLANSWKNSSTKPRSYFAGKSRILLGGTSGRISKATACTNSKKNDEEIPGKTLKKSQRSFGKNSWRKFRKKSRKNFSKIVRNTQWKIQTVLGRFLKLVIILVEKLSLEHQEEFPFKFLEKFPIELVEELPVELLWIEWNGNHLLEKLPVNS